MLGILRLRAFCAAVLVFLALPGPGTFALLNSTGKGGFRGGAAATAGLIVGDQALLWVAVGGVAALLAAHPTAFRVVQYGGAAYWPGSACRLLLAKPGAASPIRIEPRRLRPAGLPDHAAEPESDHLLHGLFPAVHPPGDTPRTGHVRRAWRRRSPRSPPPTA
jgi:hypothetical protein